MWYARQGLYGVVALSVVVSCATPMASYPIVMQGPGFDQVRYQEAVDDCRAMIERQYSSAGQAQQVAGSAGVGAVGSGKAHRIWSLRS